MIGQINQIDQQPEIQRKTDPSQPQIPIKDEDWAKDLVTIVRHFDTADRSTREKLTRKWRKQMCYWDSLQYLWWSDMVRDWRTPEEALQEFGLNQRADMDPALYAKVINIYRAHGEVIIAAMSSSTPKILFPPNDADNPDDILTSKAKSKLATMIERHNYAELLLVKALFILFNQGLVCAYNESFESEEFGQVASPIMQPTLKTTRNYYCPNCGSGLGSDSLTPSSVPPPNPLIQNPITGGQQTPPYSPTSTPPEDESLEAQPDDEVAEEALPNRPESAPPPLVPPSPSLSPSSPQITQPPIPQNMLCPNCSQNLGTEMRVQPELEDTDEIASEVTGWDVQNKSREILTFWGPLNVKVPPWVRRLQDSPYLILETEEHYAKMQSIYPEIAGFIQPSAGLERYDRSMRTPTAYQGDVPEDLVTVRRCWFRPWAYNVLGVDQNGPREEVIALRNKFPNGVYVVLINDDLVCEAVPDKLDDHWTLTQSPLSDTIHAEPTGASLMPVQEMTNELANLTLENIESAIPEVFADSDTLDFDQYEKSESRSGTTFPVTKPPGEPIGNSFYQVQGGSLSKEVELFSDRLEKVAQFVVGSIPSVWGGQIEGGSNTAREYETSRTQALQRLSTTWRLVTVWWAQLIAKAVDSYAQHMLEDESYTQAQGSGTFMNVWIRREEMNGKTGRAFAESSETLPVSWNEKRSLLMQLLQMPNQGVQTVLTHPENAGFISQTIGVPELYIPGDDDRNKQLAEIAQMIKEQPMVIPTGMMGPDGQEGTEVNSSVQIEPELDNHVVEAEICAGWLKSDVGQDMKRSNPAAYMNVLAHFRAHKQQAQMQEMQAMMAQSPQPPQGPPPSNGPAKPAPEDKNVGPIGAQQ